MNLSEEGVIIGHDYKRVCLKRAPRCNKTNILLRRLQGKGFGMKKAYEKPVIVCGSPAFGGAQAGSGQAVCRPAQASERPQAEQTLPAGGAKGCAREGLA